MSGGRHFALGAAAGAIGMTVLTAVLLVAWPSASRANQHPRALAIDPSPAIAPCARF